VRFLIFGKPDREKEPIWHAQLAVVLAIALYLYLPAKLTYGQTTRLMVPVLAVLLLLALAVVTPNEREFDSRPRRVLSIGLTALLTLANVASLGRLAHYLLGGEIRDGRGLIMAAFAIFLTNVIAFGLWYWELDGGGPGRRPTADPRSLDLLFPQQATPDATPPRWSPTFIDYLYVSLTNATAFSPTDTMPLSHRAKLLMSIQSLISLLTIALVAARAVNILG
jgi:hypothetical protein